MMIVNHSTTRVGLVGDVMVGRSFNDLLDSGNARFNVWGNTLPYLKSFDLLCGNLETTLTDCPVVGSPSRCAPWPEKAFNFLLSPRHARILSNAGFHHLNVANNHILDYRLPGLVDTLDALDSLGIRYAGAGLNVRESWTPAILERNGLRFHIFGAADHPRNWQAGVPFLPPLKGVEGIWWFDLAKPDALVDALKQYRNSGASSPRDIVMIYLHWGPNYEAVVSPQKRKLAKRLIEEAGVRVVAGTSAHHLQPYELIGQGVVFYSLGDFVDDYAIDPQFRNDLGMIASVEFDARGTLMGVETVPTRITHMRVDLL